MQTIGSEKVNTGITPEAQDLIGTILDAATALKRLLPDEELEHGFEFHWGHNHSLSDKFLNFVNMDDILIIKRLVVGSLSANCYIVGSEATRAGLLIDPGGNAADIFKAVADSGLDIKIIVLTHGHSDHIAALHDIQGRTQAEVAIHTADAQFLQGRGSFSSMFGISYKTPAPPGRLLKGGDIIDVGGLCFSVLHTPGHTPGSICLLGHNKVFTGDTLFYRGIGTTLMPGSSRRQLIDSIHTVLMVLPDDTTVYPGHGRETTIGAERKNNPFLQGW